MPFVVLVAILYVVNGLANGWSAAYDLTAGLRSPTQSDLPVVAWPLSVAGWLLVPGVAGAVAGYIVTDFIARRRTTPLHDAFVDADDD
jgi:hypothetical protein